MPRIKSTVKILLLSVILASATLVAFHDARSSSVTRLLKEVFEVNGAPGRTDVISGENVDCDVTKSKMPCTSKHESQIHTGAVITNRIRHAQSTCWRSEIANLEKDRLGGPTITYMKPKHFKYFIVDDDNRVIYCYISKAGNSHWKAVMAVLGGALKDPKKFHYNHIHEVPMKSGSVLNEPHFFRRLSEFKMEDIFSRLEDPTYRLFTFVRHPYARILSAFRDKFALNNTAVRSRYDRFYGNYIFDKYQHRNDTEAEPGYKVSWKAFARYLSDPKIQDLDEYWDTQYTMCNPCQIRYDFIGKLENSDTEAKAWISSMVNSVRNTSANMKDSKKLEMLRYASAYPNTVDEKLVRQYFARLPKDVLTGLYQRYKLDFDIFNYDPIFR